MIVIFSRTIDLATSDVMRWLDREGADVLRINEDDVQQRRIELEMGDASLRFVYGDVELSLEDVTAVWYRKGEFWFGEPMRAPELPQHPALNARLASQLKAETSRAREYFHHLLGMRARTLGNPKMAMLNKLVVLSEARAVGLSTPRSIVSNRRDAFLSAARAGRALITKAMSDGLYLWDFEQAQGYFSYTEELPEEQLENLPESIPLSFAQDKLGKSYEVRSFFLDGELYSVAIFSQASASTSVDYRKYNLEKPNRNVPYELPRDVADRLRKLFTRLNLNTGSVDWIVDEDGEHRFLEINPSGQYEPLHYFANFDISRRIAEWLMKDKSWPAN